MTKILIMEDNLRLGLEWVDAFALNNCEAKLCATVEDTIGFLEKETYDVLITDLFIGGKAGGLELLKALKKQSKTVPPIIAVTGTSPKDALGSDVNIFLKVARLFGASKQIQKPFPAGELVLLALNLYENQRS